MIIVFILIIVRSGDENKVIEKLKGHPMVKEVYKVYGEYDMIVKIEAEDINELDDFRNKVLGKIREMVMSETLIASSYGGGWDD
ncbi:Lrp/AsnC family transcriptional regulator [Thermococcus sp. M39]|uniref:Lrp/AsnC ligand binding domain-containing protein n=1 Tax=unclassified Thermococcus TaxID=2627626 RepID=UPI00143C269D|nr:MULTISPECIES: Lrp/AsnC ligand binding domain-containing protein [unclassified Thermococcus]NJE07494.1 Lrp/AsnC family transcriptional regulator [Thermococcus sp. M39]NJE13818.1 Lrp/AsnC family transcriptional regulator [Thermococcus sp. LS2]